ncbi:DUF3617 domain-containing protein [Dyella tabacisoli]|uniref:DUF3617 family protein n=1 Tax=Dyella tabacisoli TaxID=2282381 RepID=A0A369UV38_9GAMM|nr:hypothetical protein [Dyella tabacisoli]RDD83470.1 DUF3617 family protein [Dyella tabacisoli]
MNISSAALALLIAFGLSCSPGHADPGDFKAMPGLWKTVTHIVKQGQPGQPTIRWHCEAEDMDPWIAFADISVPNMSCQRSDQHRSSTALAWIVTCPGATPINGKGRVDFDSPEHYTASVTLQDRGEVLHIEGSRHAACTSPSD